MIDLGHGWLPRDEDLPCERFGIRWELNEPSTRREEYNILSDILEETNPSHVLDAGCGYMPYIHRAPYLAAQFANYVLALDTDEQHLRCPEHPRIERCVHSIFDLTELEGTYDLGLCISTLEHTDPECWLDFGRGITERIESGGLLYVSADWTPYDLWPRLLEPAFDCGSVFDEPDEIAQQGGENTSYCIARRR